MSEWKTGTLFSFPISESEYLTGRVVLAMGKELLPHDLIPLESGLDFFRSSTAIQIYDQVHSSPTTELGEVLIPSMVSMARPEREDEWEVVGHMDTSIEDLEFPVVLSGRRVGQIDLCWGEVMLPMSITRQEWIEEFGESVIEELRKGDFAAKRMGGHPMLDAGSVVGYCLHKLDRITAWDDRDNIDVRWFPPAQIDLRFSDYHDWFWDHVDVDLEVGRDRPYHEFALYYGWDAGRFFVEVTDEGWLHVCPHCMTAVEESTEQCPNCHRELAGNDEPAVYPIVGYNNSDRVRCDHCGARIMEVYHVDFANACWWCGKWR